MKRYKNNWAQKPPGYGQFIIIITVVNIIILALLVFIWQFDSEKGRQETRGEREEMQQSPLLSSLFVS